MDQDHPQPSNAETDDWVFSSGISPGALLRREREKKGLSYTQISQQTRLRPHFLEAIENEEWDLLPAPTLVKGFIRSYARILGLDEERILELYREEAGPHGVSETFVLPSIPRRKKWPFVVVGLLVFLAGVSAFYGWFTLSTGPIGSVGSSTVSIQSLPISGTPAEPPKQPKSETQVPIEKGASEVSHVESTAEPSAVSPESDKDPKNDLPEPAASQTAGEETSKTEVPSGAKKADVTTLTLKGQVTERTWVRISIDGLKSKEYVFGPSDTPEWKGEKGFELLIGNAGGIVLEFNGKKMDNLGKRGQVVRIKLPEEEERSSASN